jgi:hypothetical protein
LVGFSALLFVEFENDDTDFFGGSFGITSRGAKGLIDYRNLRIILWNQTEDKRR